MHRASRRGPDRGRRPSCISPSPAQPARSWQPQQGPVCGWRGPPVAPAETCSTKRLGTCRRERSGCGGCGGTRRGRRQQAAPRGKGAGRTHPALGFGRAAGASGSRGSRGCCRGRAEEAGADAAQPGNGSSLQVGAAATKHQPTPTCCARRPAVLQADSLYTVRLTCPSLALCK